LQIDLHLNDAAAVKPHDNVQWQNSVFRKQSSYSIYHPVCRLRFGGFRKHFRKCLMLSYLCATLNSMYGSRTLLQLLYFIELDYKRSCTCATYMMARSLPSAFLNSSARQSCKRDIPGMPTVESKTKLQLFL
jgi:hypothetical protein